VIDSTLIPAMVRVGACRKGLFAGQVAIGRSVSKTEWVYGFKVGLAVSPAGVATTFGLAPADCDERPIGECLVFSDGRDDYLADTKASPRSRGSDHSSQAGRPNLAEEQPIGEVEERGGEEGEHEDHRYFAKRSGPPDAQHELPELPQADLRPVQ
jgi:hypothetical protein